MSLIKLNVIVFSPLYNNNSDFKKISIFFKLYVS